LQQEYTNLRDQHLRTGQGFLICFAVNDIASFNEAKDLHQAILRAKNPGEKIAFAVAGTKIVRLFSSFSTYPYIPELFCTNSFQDLKGQRVVPAEDSKTFAESINAAFVETSAKV